MLQVAAKSVLAGSRDVSLPGQLYVPCVHIGSPGTSCWAQRAQSTPHTEGVLQARALPAGSRRAGLGDNGQGLLCVLQLHQQMLRPL